MTAAGVAPGSGPLTLETIATVTGGALSGPGGTVPAGYSIDSRTLRPGDLFIALAGPNHDGHRFAGGALERGACGLMVSRPELVTAAIAARGSATPLIVVPDTLRALQDLASFVRRSHPVKVVGITGSAGKTTTKEMTRHTLGAAFRVHASRGNLNNLYGCPLSLLELKPEHQVSVLEMGMSYQGELARLAEIADPDIGILTNVSGVHLAHFRDVDDVAAAKGELFAGMRENTIGIFNNDDDRCRRILESFKGYPFTFGIDRPSDLTASDYRMEGLEGSSFEVAHGQNGGTRRLRVKTRFVGLHHVYNAMAAMSAGYMLGISLEAMAERLPELEPLGMRGRVVRLGESVRVLDESYNSNPAAMRFALQVLSSAVPALAGGRRVLVMGEMLELGADEVAAHQEIGRAIAAAGARVVIGVGPLARESVRAIGMALGSGAEVETRWFESAEEAAPAAAGLARQGDLILVKGSRGVGLEKVVAALRERFGEE
ncbi:MAG TPA: UDP-N-acetylmuramoyl-tripeptide--D-alanyl-D-alanine ligase [Candidatus Polarisedimenticolia bacterium]